MITSSKQITKHFHSEEFRCKCCRSIRIDERLVNNLEKLFEKLNASKCIISSGYRCPEYDKKIGGFVGYHAKGLASDCIYYDKDGKAIPSKIVICVAYDLDLFRGIAKINDNFTHLDVRTEGYYKGDETVSNNSVWVDPYKYFGVTKKDVAKYTGEEIVEKVNVYYRVKTQKHGWLPEVKNLEDYAGWENSPIVGLAVKVDKGSIKYRVHTKGGKWLGWITKYDVKDYNFGYAGNGKSIDAIQVYYYTPDDIAKKSGYKKAKYRVNNLPWMYDTESDASGDTFAGIIGVDAVKVEIIIE